MQLSTAAVMSPRGAQLWKTEVRKRGQATAKQIRTLNSIEM